MPDRVQRSATRVADCPAVALCTGKDCRRRSEFRKVRDALAEHCTILELKCVGICSGPVVVAHPASDTPLVVSKLRSKKQRQQLLRVITEDSAPPAELAQRIVGKAKRTATLRAVRNELA